MTSAINPSGINDLYPVPGVPNNTQGFRDNFAATKTNFESAASEITDLQSKGIFKSALSGTTLDNNMNDQSLYAAKIRDFSTNLVEIPTSSGAVTIDYTLGHYQRVATTGNISLSFANLPGIESSGYVRLQLIIDSAGRTVTLPTSSAGNVVYGRTGIQGLNTGTNVLTFVDAGTYDFEFVSINSDGTPLVNVVDCNRPLSYFTNDVSITANTVSGNTTTGALTVSGGVGVVGNINSGGSITTTSSLGIGYATGAGGTVTQAAGTDTKSNPVTLNAITGQITLAAYSMASNTANTFVLTNSAVANTDVMILNHVSGGNLGDYSLNAACNSGTANITIRNDTAGARNDQPVIRFVIIKGATS